ncbi:MAG: hypothetical protein R3F53_03545 [Gammaproteobacteria bacterium]
MARTNRAINGEPVIHHSQYDTENYLMSIHQLWRLVGLSAALAMLPAWLDNSFLLGSDNSTPPAELKTIEQTAGVRSLWSSNASSGSGDNLVQFTLASTGSGADRRLFVAGYDGDVSALDSHAVALGSGGTKPVCRSPQV